jgi:hypothetical protein
MINVTVTLPEETAAWARVQAAERNMSLSRFIGETLEAQRKETDAYEAAMRAWFAIKPVPLSNGEEKPYLTRDEIHDRARFRR